jgi:hypothetical protein
MSWDVMIFNFGDASPPPLERLEPNDLKPLGAASDVRQRISELLPGVNWTDLSWGIYGGEGFSIEFNVGNDDPITSIMLHVRGGGDVISTIMAFTSRLGWWALDCSTSEYLYPQNPSQAGWEGFQRYRDKIINQYRNRGDG